MGGRQDLRSASRAQALGPVNRATDETKHSEFWSQGFSPSTWQVTNLLAACVPSSMTTIMKVDVGSPTLCRDGKWG